MPKGDCYCAAGRLLMDRAIAGDADGLTLCHGTVSGQGPLDGVRYGHAWVEAVDEAALASISEAFGTPPPAVVATTVFDHSNDRELEIPAALYYAIGQIDGAEVRRYDWAALRKAVTATGHWGPWE